MLRFYLAAGQEAVIREFPLTLLWRFLVNLKWSILNAVQNPIYQGIGKDISKTQFLIAFPVRNEITFWFHRNITEIKNEFTALHGRQNPSV